MLFKLLSHVSEPCNIVSDSTYIVELFPGIVIAFLNAHNQVIQLSCINYKSFYKNVQSQYLSQKSPLWPPRTDGSLNDHLAMPIFKPPAEELSALI